MRVVRIRAGHQAEIDVFFTVLLQQARRFQFESGQGVVVAAVFLVVGRVMDRQAFSADLNVHIEVAFEAAIAQCIVVEVR